LSEAAFIVFYTAPEIEVTPEILNIVAVNVNEVQFGSAHVCCIGVTEGFSKRKLRTAEKGLVFFLRTYNL
jgi:hypothetical protein